MSDLLYYILSGVLVVGALAGISFMSKMNSSVWGNLLGVLCMAGAIFLTLYRYDILTLPELWICSAIGLAVGLILALRVKMIQMPQMVGLFNGCDGAASGIVAAVSVLDGDSAASAFGLATAGAALVYEIVRQRQL